LLGKHELQSGDHADRDFALDTSKKVVLYSDQKSLMYAGGARKEDAMNDHLLHEMARIRMDELRAEASRAHAARGARRSHGWRHYLGILAGTWAARGEAGGYSRGTMEDGCCA
jgi:hypothetical protein